jgi:hypothetical protein
MLQTEKAVFVAESGLKNCFLYVSLVDRHVFIDQNVKIAGHTGYLILHCLA